jgi:hypothetical protein
MQFWQLTHNNMIRGGELGGEPRWIRMRRRARVGREIGQGLSGKDCTRDRIMGLDGYSSKSTIPVVRVNAVPIRAIGAAVRVGERGRQPDL